MLALKKRIDIEKICKEAVAHTGDHTPNVICDMAASLLYDIKMWKEGRGNAVDMANSIAQCRIGLEMAKQYYGIPEEMIEGWIEQSLEES